MPDPVRKSFLEWLMQEQEHQQNNYRTYRDYYDGEHNAKLTERQRSWLKVNQGIEFRANYCELVVNSLAEKLNVIGFAAGTQSVQLWEWWQDARMDGEQGDAHLSTIRDGDAYIITSYNNEEQRPEWTTELAFDGSEGVKLHYSSERKGDPAFASKRWKIAGEDVANAGYMRRLNVYFPDRIEKYVSDQRVFKGNWTPYKEDGEWPLWWTTTGKEGGEPLGLPVQHMRYKSAGYNYGKSRIDSVIPLQDAANKALVDVLSSADMDGFPLIFTFGDDFGDLTVGPGAHLYSEKADVKAGRIGGGDLSQLIAAYNMTVYEIAKVSSTPLSRFQITGQVASAATLKEQETGLVADAENFQVSAGNTWEDALAMGRKLHNVFGDGDAMDESQLISTEWKSAVTRDETATMKRGLMLLEADVPHEIVWAKMGLSADEIATALQSTEYLALVAGRQAMMNLGDGDGG